MRWSGDRGAVITIVPSNRPRCCRTGQATCSVNQPVTATDTAMIAALELLHLRLQPGVLRRGWSGRPRDHIHGRLHPPRNARDVVVQVGTSPVEIAGAPPAAPQARHARLLRTGGSRLGCQHPAHPPPSPHPDSGRIQVSAQTRPPQHVQRDRYPLRARRAEGGWPRPRQHLHWSGAGPLESPVSKQHPSAGVRTLELTTHDGTSGLPNSRV